MTGMVFDVQELTVHDGPGGRITFFFKGCPLRCIWCHNPEGQSSKQELLFVKDKCIGCKSCLQRGVRTADFCPTGALKKCGVQLTAEEIVNRAVQLKATLKLLQGGVTFSGGEPCAQPEFLIECLKRLKKEGIHTAIETSGYCLEEQFQRIIELCDFVYMDIKLMDDTLHQTMTGVSNQLILKNAQVLKNSQIPHCFRTPMIPGITDTKENLSAIAAWLKDAPWEKLPYNELAKVKYEQCGRIYEYEKVISKR